MRLPSQTAQAGALTSSRVERGRAISTQNGSVQPAGSQPGPSTSAERGAPTKNFHCWCGGSFTQRDGLTRHQRTCNRTNQTRCSVCDTAFRNFAAVRQHERQVHPEEYAKSKVPKSKEERTEPELMALIAKYESTCRSFSYPEAMRVSGLTRERVRHRRESDVYKRYLAEARAAQRREATKTFSKRPTCPPSAPAKRTYSSVVGTRPPTSAPSRQATGPSAYRSPPAGGATTKPPLPDRLVCITSPPTAGPSGSPPYISPQFREEGGKRARRSSPTDQPASRRPRRLSSPAVMTSPPASGQPPTSPPASSQPAKRPSPAGGGSPFASRPSPAGDGSRSTARPSSAEGGPPPALTPAQPSSAEDGLPSAQGPSPAGGGLAPPTRPSPAGGGRKRARVSADSEGGMSPPFRRLPPALRCPLTPSVPGTTSVGAAPVDPVPAEDPLILPVVPLSLEHRRLSMSVSGLDEQPAEARPVTTIGESSAMLEAVTAFREGADAPDRSLVTATLIGTCEDLKRVMDEWVTRAFPRATPSVQSTASSAIYPRQPNHPLHMRYNQRMARYKKTQNMYERQRCRLAATIFAGGSVDDVEVVPDIAEVDVLYRGILESPSPADSEAIMDPIANEVSGQYIAISETEVKEAKRGWAKSAPGTDGVTVAMVLACSARKLALLFTSALYRKVTPSSWHASRTVLVPKTGDLTNPSNWRPITIGSALQRLMHRVLYRRLSTSVTLAHHQRGFTDTDGVMANAMVLQHYIKTRRGEGKSYNVVSCDVRKAFDSVSHHSIRRALMRQGVHEGLLEYIMFSLTTTSTHITVGRQRTDPIKVTRGVKQGDPLSPLLFNIVIDEVLVGLNDGKHGGSLTRDVHCAALAFADDVVLLEDRDVEMPLSLAKFNNFLSRRGMTLNAAKCASVSCTVAAGSSIPRRRPIFAIGAVKVPIAENINTFRYLGHHFGDDGCRPHNITTVESWLVRLRKAALKPEQKVVMVRDHLIPKLHHGLQNPSITAEKLRNIDRLIKMFVKATLQLPVTTNDTFLYASRRDGGLGIQNLRMSIPQIYCNRLMRLSIEGDETIRSVMGAGYAARLMDRLGQLAPVGSIRELWRDRLEASPMVRGIEQGDGTAVGSAWLSRRPYGWTGRDYVQAVKLRANALPSVGIPSNAPENRMCRAGCNAVESVCHILQKCHLTHGMRVARHDHLVKKLAAHTRSMGWVTDVEPRVRHGGHTMVPDLVVHKSDGTITICDAQVSWEVSLPNTWQAKRSKYDCSVFHQAAARKWPGKELRFLPIIVGARGTWPSLNHGTARDLGLGSVICRQLVQGTLKWGCSIHKQFMDHVYERPPQRRTTRPDGHHQTTRRRGGQHHQGRPPEGRPSGSRAGQTQRTRHGRGASQHHLPPP